MCINFQRIIGLCKNINLLPTNSPYFAGNVKCDNCFFGEYQNNSFPNILRTSINRNNSNQSNSVIVIILAESPHIHEYTFKNGNILAKSPLYKYNKKISQKIGGHLPSNITSADVYLFNSIPYQCSFGNKLYGKNNFNKEKNDVFSLTWNLEFGLDNLIFEINKLIVNNEKLIILNACTESLKTCCNSNVLVEKLKLHNLQVLDVPHVSHW